MSRILAAFLLLSSLLLFAGCIDDRDVAPPLPDAPDGTSPSPPAAVEAAAGSDDGRPAVARRVPVDESGTTSRGVWFCTEPYGTGGCAGQEVEGGDYTARLAFDGVFAGAALNLTWEPLDPTLETMVVAYGWETGDGVHHQEPFEATAPVPIVIDQVAFGPDGTFFVALWPAAEARTQAGAAFVDVQRQPFSVGGHLLIEPN